MAVTGALKADMVLLNGRVVTVDTKDSIAGAVAIKSGRIVAVGSSAGVKLFAGKDTEVLDLAGKMVLQGSETVIDNDVP